MLLYYYIPFFFKDAQGRNIALASVMSRILNTDTNEKVYNIKIEIKYIYYNYSI